MFLFFFPAHQCRVHALACRFPLLKQTLDLCFEAFIKQKHPLQSATGWLIWEKIKNKKNDVGVPLTHSILIMSTQAGMYTNTGHIDTHTQAEKHQHFEFFSLRFDYNAKALFYTCDCIMLKTVVNTNTHRASGFVFKDD